MQRRKAARRTNVTSGYKGNSSLSAYLLGCDEPATSNRLRAVFLRHFTARAIRLDPFLSVRHLALLLWSELGRYTPRTIRPIRPR